MLKQLRDREKVIYLLYFVQIKSIEEISELLGWNKEYIKKTVQFIRVKLQDCFDKKELKITLAE
jgi:DNA-directed RNA polymerase specialized sigma24 family protein